MVEHGYKLVIRVAAGEGRSHDIRGSHAVTRNLYMILKATGSPKRF